jgi:NAD(P)H-dependent flavin oxidoreductase YrpB (nitropropane dioxygenase family)
MEFIFMLTHDDRTVPEALEVYRGLAGTDLRYVGFKDVGVDADGLRALTDAMHADARTVFLEVVSTSREEEIRSVESAVRAGVDYVLGGTNTDEALSVLAGSGVRYCPFPGTVVGHPSRLRGTIAAIAEHAAELTARDGVDGVDLLAYRHHEVPVTDLVAAVVAASAGPVIVAGSIDSAERIREVAAAGAWAFTIGGAIFERRLPGAPDIAAQVQWALETGRKFDA